MRADSQSEISNLEFQIEGNEGPGTKDQGPRTRDQGPGTRGRQESKKQKAKNRNRGRQSKELKSPGSQETLCARPASAVPKSGSVISHPSSVADSQLAPPPLRLIRLNGKGDSSQERKANAGGKVAHPRTPLATFNVQCLPLQNDRLRDAHLLNVKI